jgi:hypothetical protein
VRNCAHRRPRYSATPFSVAAATADWSNGMSRSSRRQTSPPMPGQLRHGKKKLAYDRRRAAEDRSSGLGPKECDMKSSVAALIWVGASAVAGVAAHSEVRGGKAPASSGLNIPFKPSTAFRCAITLSGTSPTASTTLPSDFGFVLTSLTFTQISPNLFGRTGSDFSGRPRINIVVGGCVETHPVAAPQSGNAPGPHGYLDYASRVLRFDPPLVASPNEFVSFELVTDPASTSGSTVLIPADSIGFVIGGYVVPPEDL